MSIILWTYLWPFTLGHYQLITQPLSLDSSGLVPLYRLHPTASVKGKRYCKTSVSDLRSVKKVQRLIGVRATLHHPRHDRTKLNDGRTNSEFVPLPRARQLCRSRRSSMRTRNLPSSAMPSLHLSNRRRSIRSTRGSNNFQHAEGDVANKLNVVARQTQDELNGGAVHDNHLRSNDDQAHEKFIVDSNTPVQCIFYGMQFHCG